MFCNKLSNTPSIVAFEDFVKLQDKPQIPGNKVKLKANKRSKEENVNASQSFKSFFKCSYDNKNGVKSRKRSLAKNDSKNNLNKNVVKKRCRNDIKQQEVIILDDLSSSTPLRNKSRIVENIDLTIHNPAIKQEKSGSDPLWCEKHNSSTSSEVLVDISATLKLMTWLKSWKLKIEKEHQQLLLEVENLKHKKRYDEDDDFVLDKDEYFDDDDSLAKIFIVKGSSGCFKTSTVHTCAREAGFKVLELNAGSDRSNKAMVEQLREATQSHLVTKLRLNAPSSGKNTLKNFFSSNQKSKSTEKSSKETIQHQASNSTLILLDEVEAVLGPDKNFWVGVNYLLKVTKRPLVVTTTQRSTLDSLQESFEEVTFKRPTLMKLVKQLQRIAKREGLSLSRSHCEEILKACSHDMRQSILTTQFWKEPFASHPMVDYSHFTPLRQHLAPHQHQSGSLVIRTHAGEPPGKGCWSNESGDGDLLSCAINRQQIQSSHPLPAKSKPVTQEDVVIKDPTDGVKLKEIGECLEVLSLIDGLEGGIAMVYPNHPWVNCHTLDGVLDLAGEEIEMTSHSEVLFADMFNYLNARTSTSAFNPAPHRAIPMSQSIQIYDDLLRELHPNIGSHRSAHLDYLPSLRSISRVEDSRKRHRTTRRFLHYFDAMAINISTHTAHQLAHEFVFS